MYHYAVYVIGNSLVFFFKQKTAYEMRISCWSSDVCSADLVDKLGEAQTVAPAEAGYRPSDPQIAFHLARFIENVRSIPSDPIVLRQDWLRAYDFTTDKGAAALNDYARGNDPFAQVGKVQVAVDVSSVIRASPGSFQEIGRAHV